MGSSEGISRPWIQTYTGKRFVYEDVLNGDTSAIDIVDVARSLSYEPRYNGQTKRRYSVAHHSLICAEVTIATGIGDPIESLIHDAHEAYVKDVPTPLKQMVGWAWTSLEAGILRTVYRALLPKGNYRSIMSSDANFVDHAVLMWESDGPVTKRVCDWGIGVPMIQGDWINEIVREHDLHPKQWKKREGYEDTMYQRYLDKYKKLMKAA